MDEGSADKTIFITREGTFRFRVIPFGFTVDGSGYVCAEFGSMYNISRRYYRLLNRHPESSGAAGGSVSRLRAAALKHKPSKYKLFRPRLGFLGHIVSEEGIEIDSAKIESIVTWPVPTTVREVKGFLGFCSYYRRFVMDFAEMAAPLLALTGKHVRL